MNKKIIYDLTTVYDHKQDKPTGILRAELNIAKKLKDSNNTVTFIRFDKIKMRFMHMHDQHIEDIIEAYKDDSYRLTNNQPTVHTSDAISVISNIYKRTCRLVYKAAIKAIREVRRIQYKVLVRQQYQDPFYKISEDIKNHDIYLCVSYPIRTLEKITQFCEKESIEYIQMVHDLIPVKHPEFFKKRSLNEFMDIIHMICNRANKIIVQSRSTANDLIEYTEKIDAPKPVMKHIALPDLTQGMKDIHRYQPRNIRINELKPGDFILYVSTIEPRKNHITIYHALKQMLDDENPPTIVFAGATGWLSTDLIHIMKSNPQIYPKHLKIFSGLDDNTISWLYQNCKFTVYPSLYEGWGLPIQESLSLGKFCISSSTSSMPEAGKHFADYISPLDISTWVEKIRYYWNNKAALQAKESEIRNNFTVQCDDCCDW